MRIFFTILGVAGSVVLLLLLGVAIAVWTVDPNDFLRPIQERVQEATGRELAIGGGIDLKLGLVPKLVLSDVRIGNAPWGKAPDLVTAKRVEAQVALLPLLQRRFELVRLKLQDPVIALETDARGRGNWELGAATGQSATDAKQAAAPESYVFGNIAIENGVLTYRDGATGSVTKVAIDAFSVTARDPGSPVDAEFRGRIDDIAVALTGSLGPLATLAQRHLPYPIAVKGEVAGRKTSMVTQVHRADDVVELRDLEVTAGQSNVKGQVDIRSVGPRTRLSVNLTSPSLAIEDLPLLPAAAPAATPKPVTGAQKGPSRYLFADDAVPFDVLRARDVDGEATIGRLALSAGRHIDGVRLRFVLRDGKLDVSSFQASVFGGSAAGTLTIDATRGRDPAMKLHVDGRDFDLAALLAAAGRPREVRGGKTQLAIDVVTRGDSPREWVSAMTGTVRAVVGPATLVNTKVDPSVPIDRIVDAVNPFRNVDPTTELKCAVIRLPLERGIARIDRSVAIETGKIDASASGTLDFRDETIDLAIKPEVKGGLPPEIPQIADLVRVRGTFVAPVVGIDAMAAAAVIARIGAGIGTSGLSEVGRSLFMRGARGDAHLCDIALGRAPAAKSAPSGAPKAGSAPTPTDDLGKALGRLLGR